MGIKKDMRVRNENIEVISITKTFEVVIDEKRIAKVEKWIEEDDTCNIYESDYEIKNLKELGELTDEEEDELQEVISLVKMSV